MLGRSEDTSGVFVQREPAETTGDLKKMNNRTLLHQEKDDMGTKEPPHSRGPGT